MRKKKKSLTTQIKKNEEGTKKRGRGDFRRKRGDEGGGVGGEIKKWET